jgi:hypothetical protein
MQGIPLNFDNPSFPVFLGGESQPNANETLPMPAIFRNVRRFI